jgi:hypothetical protein
VSDLYRDLSADPDKIAANVALLKSLDPNFVADAVRGI